MRKEAIIREHGDIAQAIAERDSDRVRRAMRAHLLGGTERLFGEQA